jgi:hypothetical protein
VSETQQEITIKTIEYLGKVLNFYEVGSVEYLYYKDIMERFGNKEMIDDFSKKNKPMNLLRERNNAMSNCAEKFRIAEVALIDTLNEFAVNSRDYNNIQHILLDISGYIRSTEVYEKQGKE